MTDKMSGYVYILEVADIDLPVCKIGMTTRDPISRCHEINKSSTGDFIWAVAHFISVDDCKELEKLIHYKLSPLRQKRREFFNLCADDAYKAIKSIFDSQSNIKIIESIDPQTSPQTKLHRKKNNSNFPNRPRSEEYAALLQTFCEVLEIKGRPFGQLNKPFFGMSDGNEGVQWNIAVQPKSNEISLGVNLEGLMYKNWPISKLIKSELKAPELPKIIEDLKTSDQIFLSFWRDAWQVASRPEIKEKYIGGKPFKLNELTEEKWRCILNEALECLDKEHDYQRRSKQKVTLVKKDGKNMTQFMAVSPHLTIWSPLTINENIEVSIRNKIIELKSIHSWMKQLS